MNAEATIKENLTVRFGGLSRIRPISGQFLGWLAKIVADVFPSTSLRISRLQEISPHDTLPPSLPIQRPGLVTRWNKGATAPQTRLQAFFSSVILCYGGCAWDVFGRAGFLDSPVYQPAHSCHPFAWYRMRGNFLNQGSEQCAASIRTKFGLPPNAISNRNPTVPPSTEVANDRSNRTENHRLNACHLLPG
ncbi:hypothetical protein J2Y86_003695 [Pseudomonas migulae]|nr:hypothetical protein [Pseudomonas migulae]